MSAPFLTVDPPANLIVSIRSIRVVVLDVVIVSIIGIVYPNVAQLVAWEVCPIVSILTPHPSWPVKS